MVSFEAQERPKEMKKFHEKIITHKEKVNASYKTRANKHRKPLAFNMGEFVWLYLMKERFPRRRKNFS